MEALLYTSRRGDVDSAVVHPKRRTRPFRERGTELPMISRASALLLSFVLVTVAAAASEEESAPPAAGSNVAITLTVGRAGGAAGAKEKAYRFVGQDGAVSRILMGWRTPLPTRTADDKASDGASTSYIYQNVGVTADLNAQSVGGGRFLVSGQIEVSGSRDAPTVGEAGKPPLIGTFQQALDVVVTNGKKLRIAEGPDPESGTLYIDLRVDLLE
jgi:hypothetical protein